jgi:26S proteasome regulatory subunit N1
VGTAREEVLEMLRPIIDDAATGLDTVAHACLALGLVFAGSAHGDATQTLLSALMERAGPAAEANSLMRFACLGLGLLFLGAPSPCFPFLCPWT